MIISNQMFIRDRYFIMNRYRYLADVPTTVDTKGPEFCQTPGFSLYTTAVIYYPPTESGSELFGRGRKK